MANSEYTHKCRFDVGELRVEATAHSAASVNCKFHPEDIRNDLIGVNFETYKKELSEGREVRLPHPTDAEGWVSVKLSH